MKIVHIYITIDNIYLDQDVTIKEAFISTDEQIFNDESELTKYLLFGSLNSKCWLWDKEL